MNIELRNLKTYPGISEETLAFSAKLFIDGQPCGEVSNRGHGDPIYFTDHNAERRVDAFAKTLPPIITSYCPEGMQQNAEIYIDDLITAENVRKEFARKIKNRVMMRNADGVMLETKTIKDAATLQRAITHYTAKYGSENVLNVLQFDTALALFAAVGR